MQVSLHVIHASRGGFSVSFMAGLRSIHWNKSEGAGWTHDPGGLFRFHGSTDVSVLLVSVCFAEGF